MNHACRSATALAVFLAASIVGPAQSQPVATMITSGPCASSLNGADLGCDDKHVVTELQNGRAVVSFTGKDVASIGFAGPGIKGLTEADKVLWVDGAYINQQRFPADGQCSIKGPPPTISLECRAILRDGRKLVAEARRATTNGPVAVGGDDCATTVKTHGYASRAQFQCGFNQYNNEMIAKAQQCRSSLGDEGMETSLMAGMQSFDREEKSRGHNRACEAVLRKHPNIVRR